MLAVWSLAFWFTPLRAQDDNGAAPPPPDSAAAAAPDDAGAAPDDSASFQTFYDSLANQGTWIQSSDYGYVWQPQVNDPDWAPYTAGHWVYTDDGWTWVSDESWGWATYHYGRWVNLDGTGWCWVPGYTWAPAWVSWRYGGGYCGWAPLPPDSFVGIDYSDDGLAIGIGFHIGGDCDGFYGIGAGCYNFLPVTCLGYRNYHGYYSPRGDNFAIINHTTNVTNINVARTSTGISGATTGARSFDRVTTGGPALAQVNAVSSTPIQKVNLVRASQPGGGGTLTADSLALYAPHVNPSPTTQPSRVAGSIGQARINRGADIMRPLAVNSVLAAPAATEAQVQQARLAQNHAPASAKVVTDSELVRPVLQAPLTSLKPLARQVNPSPAFNSSQTTMNPNQRAATTRVITPTVRTYPQTGEEGGSPSRVYYPGTVSPPAPSIYQPPASPTTANGGTQYHQNVQPAFPSSGTGTHQSQSTGGYSGGSGRSSNGGGAGQARSGGTGGSSHSSGSSQSH